MIAQTPTARSGNLQKHSSRNPVQQWLLARFHAQVAALVAEGLVRSRTSRRLAIDVGCGEGFAAAALVHHLPGIQVIGVDARREALNTIHSRAITTRHPDEHPSGPVIARRPGKEAMPWQSGADGQLLPYPDVPSGCEPEGAQRVGPEQQLSQPVLADAHNLPFQTAVAPVVLCLEVLEHLEQPWAALEELTRVSSAYLVLSVPDQPLFAIANLARGKNVSRLGEDPEHLSHWRGATFLRELNDRCEVVRAVRSFPWVLALARV